MNDPRYKDLEKLIDEYEVDTQNICSTKLILQNYPQVFTLSVASSFENNIKLDLDSFLMNPLHPLTTYPGINQMVNSNNPTPVPERMYKKFYTDPALTAEPFYQLFNGAPFKTSVQTHFANRRAQELTSYQSRVAALETLINNSSEDEEKYANAYVAADDRAVRLQQLTFDVAEQAFLNIKKRRNQVAHDFIHGLTDSFVDLRTFYFDAIIYILALSDALADLTTATT